MFKRMGTAKRVFAAWMSCLIILLVILTSSITAKASLAVPIMPYIPPNTTEMMDLVFNIFGATAANITDEAEKAEAYIKLFQAVYGSAWENAYNDFLEMFDDGKTSGKLTFDLANIATANEIISYAIEHGMQYGESYAASMTAQQWKDRLQAQYGIYGDISVFNHVFSYKKTNYVTSGNFYIAFVIYEKNGSKRINFQTISAQLGDSVNLKKYSNGFYYWMYENGSYANEPLSCGVYEYQYNETNHTIGALIEEWAGGNAFSTFSQIGTTSAYAGTVANVQAISQNIEDALENDVASVLTPQTDTVNPFVSITINLPVTLPVPATTVQGVEDVQEQLHIQTVPNTISSDDIADIVSELQQSYAAQYGDVSEYSLDLTEYFPFCIPFDIGNLLNMFVAEPQAPQFQFQLPVGYDVQEGIVLQEFTMDLSMFDEVAVWVRRGMVLIFIVGLGLITRQVFTRG